MSPSFSRSALPHSNSNYPIFARFIQLLSLSCICLFNIQSHAQSITVSDPNRTYQLFDNSEALEINPGQIIIDSLLQHPERYRFVSVMKKPIKPEAAKAFEGTKDYWFRFELSNRITTDLALQFLLFHDRQAVVYEVANRRVLHRQTFTGISSVINPNENFRTKTLIFPLAIPRGQSHTVYIHVPRMTLPTMHITAQSIVKLQQELHTKDLMAGLFMGFILMIVIYGLMLFARMGDRVNLIYAVWVLLATWISQGTNGELINLSPALHNIYASYPTVIMFCTGLVHLLFTTSFLQLRQRAKGLYRLSRWALAFYFVGIVLILANQRFFILFFLGSTIGVLFTIAAGIVIYRKGFKPALYFLIGMIVYFLGQYVYLSTLWGFYPLTFWTYHSINLGSFGEILLFTLGLTYKINLLKLEREQAVEEQLRLSEANRHLIETQKQALEEQVEQRTAELKASQAQLIQKEKLASLGELTAGIAHEIQNPLNFVNNFSEVSAELVEEIKEERKKVLEERDGALEEELLNDLSLNLEKITLHGKRASNIVKGMLEHSRTTSGEKQLIDLNALAEEYLRLAFQGQRTKDKTFNCALQINFDPTLPPVNMVPQEMGRVLLNLYNNAFYALLERAKQDGQPYEPIVSIRTSHQNGRVEIRVKDNGQGIPIGIREKIFQPFFTTKPTGEGTGLGLSLSYDIVTKGHQGEMKAESREGEGAEFIISLPLGSKAI